jgi:hypothetical protein
MTFSLSSNPNPNPNPNPVEDSATFDDLEVGEGATMSLVWEDTPGFTITLFAPHYKAPQAPGGVAVLQRVGSKMSSGLRRSSSNDAEVVPSVPVFTWPEETVGGLVLRVAGKTPLPVYLTAAVREIIHGTEPLAQAGNLAETPHLGEAGAVEGSFLIVQEPPPEPEPEPEPEQDCDERMDDCCNACCNACCCADLEEEEAFLGFLTLVMWILWIAGACTPMFGNQHRPWNPES